LDPPATDRTFLLEHDDVETVVTQISCRHQTGDPCADHRYAVSAPARHLNPTWD
jgi:hypothetical protein